MFDPGFFELVVICVVALLVLGPDKLPGAIKTLGLWIGRLRRSFNNIKREIEQEVGADEIRRQLRNEAIMEKFNSTKKQVTESIESVKKEAESVKDGLDLTKEFSGIADESRAPASSEESDADELDPVEQLATNDPAARVISPTAEELPATNTADTDATNKQNDTTSPESSDDDESDSGVKPEQ